MRTRYRPAASSGTGALTMRIHGMFVRILRSLGISRVVLDMPSDGAQGGLPAAAVEYFDGVPQAVRSMSESMIDAIAGMMLMSGMSSVSIELADDELADSTRLWNGEAVPQRLDERVSVVNVEDEERAARKAAEAKSLASASFDGDVSVSGLDDDAKIVAVYEAVAEMLPVEGRDYRLNPAVKENGAVGFSPVAMTMAGKVWLDYLSTHLGGHLAEKAARSAAYLAQPVAGPDAVINEQPPTGGTHDEEAEEGR